MLLFTGCCRLRRQNFNLFSHLEMEPKLADNIPLRPLQPLLFSIPAYDAMTNSDSKKPRPQKAVSNFPAWAVKVVHQDLLL